MKARPLPFLLCLSLILCLGLCACGYQFLGSGQNLVTPIGEGQNILRLEPVEHYSLYTWLDAYARAGARDEIRLRRLGRFDEAQSPDYLVQIRVPQVLTTVSSGANQVTLMEYAEITYELLFIDPSDQGVVWRSNLVTASAPVTQGREEDALREALDSAVKAALDRLQQSF